MFKFYLRSGGESVCLDSVFDIKSGLRVRQFLAVIRYKSAAAGGGFVRNCKTQ